MRAMMSAALKTLVLAPSALAYDSSVQLGMTEPAKNVYCPESPGSMPQLGLETAKNVYCPPVSTLCKLCGTPVEVGSTENGPATCQNCKDSQNTILLDSRLKMVKEKARQLREMLPKKQMKAFTEWKKERFETMNKSVKDYIDFFENDVPRKFLQLAGDLLLEAKDKYNGLRICWLWQDTVEDETNLREFIDWHNDKSNVPFVATKKGLQELTAHVKNLTEGLVRHRTNAWLYSEGARQALLEKLRDNETMPDGWQEQLEATFRAESERKGRLWMPNDQE